LSCGFGGRQQAEDEVRPVVANLGVHNAMYFDKDKGKWRERGKEHLEEADRPLAPPPATGSVSSVKKEAPGEAKEQSALDSLMAPPNPYGSSQLGRLGASAVGGMPRHRAPTPPRLVARTSAFPQIPAPRTAAGAVAPPPPDAAEGSPDIGNLF